MAIMCEGSGEALKCTKETSGQGWLERSYTYTQTHHRQTHTHIVLYSTQRHQIYTPNTR